MPSNASKRHSWYGIFSLRSHSPPPKHSQSQRPSKSGGRSVVVRTKSNRDLTVTLPGESGSHLDISVPQKHLSMLGTSRPPILSGTEDGTLLEQEEPPANESTTQAPLNNINTAQPLLSKSDSIQTPVSANAQPSVSSSLYPETAASVYGSSGIVNDNGRPRYVNRSSTASSVPSVNASSEYVSSSHYPSDTMLPRTFSSESQQNSVTEKRELLRARRRPPPPSEGSVIPDVGAVPVTNAAPEMHAVPEIPHVVPIPEDRPFEEEQKEETDAATLESPSKTIPLSAVSPELLVPPSQPTEPSLSHQSSSSSGKLMAEIDYEIENLRGIQKDSEYTAQYGMPVEEPFGFEEASQRNTNQDAVSSDSVPDFLGSVDGMSSLEKDFTDEFDDEFHDRLEEIPESLRSHRRIADLRNELPEEVTSTASTPILEANEEFKPPRRDIDLLTAAVSPMSGLSTASENYFDVNEERPVDDEVVDEKEEEEDATEVDVTEQDAAEVPLEAHREGIPIDEMPNVVSGNAISTSSESYSTTPDQYSVSEQGSQRFASPLRSSELILPTPIEEHAGDFRTPSPRQNSEGLVLSPPRSLILPSPVPRYEGQFDGTPRGAEYEDEDEDELSFIARSSYRPRLEPENPHRMVIVNPSEGSSQGSPKAASQGEDRSEVGSIPPPRSAASFSSSSTSTRESVLTPKAEGVQPSVVAEQQPTEPTVETEEAAAPVDESERIKPASYDRREQPTVEPLAHTTVLTPFGAGKANTRPPPDFPGEGRARRSISVSTANPGMFDNSNNQQKESATSPVAIARQRNAIMEKENVEVGKGQKSLYVERLRSLGMSSYTRQEPPSRVLPIAIRPTKPNHRRTPSHQATVASLQSSLKHGNLRPKTRMLASEIDDSELPDSKLSHDLAKTKVPTDPDAEIIEVTNQLKRLTADPAQLSRYSRESSLSRYSSVRSAKGLSLGGRELKLFIANPDESDED
ncbi:DEKNAAC101001 [Brettanomyces naardenensis]|uniref:DEKNAAC101001 n=1 Tax=Brettanomyces naardenensis TaxID=13370 RepID=A0A448YGR1_BRENA|nr:DEKNAAC101001 [Brettanomyces naardenensis]